MSAFTRKRSIDKRLKQQQPTVQLTQTLTTTRTTLRPSSSRISSAGTKNISQNLFTIQNLNQQDFSQINLQKLSQNVTSVIRTLLQSNRGVLVGQKLSACKQCSILVTKFHIQVRKNGKNIDDYVDLLGHYRTIAQDLNRITKEPRHEQLVAESGLVPVIMSLLQEFAVDVQSLAANAKQRKGSLMRKNSLKKAMESTTSSISSISSIKRPTSRGKLSSLNKKQSIGSKGDILNLKVNLEKQPEEEPIKNFDMNALEQIIYNICCCLKNLTIIKPLRKDLLKQQYLRILNRYLLIWNQKTLANYGTSILIQLTAASRYIASEDRSQKLFLKSNCFEPWTKIIQMFPTSNDLVFNMIRILSKLSSSQQVCEKLFQKKQFLKVLTSFFKAYKTQIHVVIRVSYIFANMTSFLSQIRTQLYFQSSAWDDIYQCFEHYANSELKGKSQVDKMGVSMAAWDYKAMTKQSDIEALMKIIRLIANLFTVPEIGQSVYREHSNHYRDLIKTLKMLLEKKSNLQKHNELIACVLSCLTNTLYYDREMLLASNQYKTVKKQLIQSLIDFVVQIDNQQVCCESLRVVSNLTRMKQFVKPVLDAKLHEAVIILLDSTSKQIVYYSLGIIINLLADDQFKSTNRQILVSSIVQILRQCQNDDFDVVTVALKCLFIIIDNRTQNISPSQLAQVQNCLVSLGAHCDKSILSNTQQNNNNQIQTIQQSRNLINALLNSMPQEKYTCPHKNCGRKFADEPRLQEHLLRRHKNS